MEYKELVWIEQGYRTFAYEGPSALKIERMAKSVAKNKSSFYHFFADLEVFTNRLLSYHEQQAKEMARKESEAQTEADLTEIIINHRLDLLFNRQLRIHRENAAFSDCFQKINKFSLPGLLPLWKVIIGLEENNYLAQAVLMLSIENFFLQITDETLNKAWITGYFAKIREMVSLFKASGVVSSVDGGV